MTSVEICINSLPVPFYQYTHATYVLSNLCIKGHIAKVDEGFVERIALHRDEKKAYTQTQLIPNETENEKRRFGTNLSVYKYFFKSCD